MKNRFLTFLFMLPFMLLVVVSGWGYSISTPTHDWSTPDNEQYEHEPLTGEAYKYASIGHSFSPRTKTGSFWVSSYAGVSLEVNGELLNVGEEMNVTGWIEATSDQALVSSPSKNSINTNKSKRDGEGRRIYYDKKSATTPRPNGSANAVTAYKKHPVAVYSSNPIPLLFLPGDERVERNYYHSVYAFAYFSDENTPDALPDLNPYATGSLEATSRSTINLPIGAVTFSTPKCTDPAHAPGPCPGD